MAELTSLERVSLILQHKEADHVPVYPLINSISWKHLGIGYDEWTKDPDLCARAIIKTTDDLDVDVICSLVDLSVEAADWGQEIVYSPVDAACPNNVNNPYITCDEDYAIKVPVIDPRKTPRMSAHIRMCKQLVAAKGKEKPIVGFVFAPLGLLSMMRGQAAFFMDLMLCPDKVHIALRNITDTLKIYVKELINAGCHAIMFDTLFASRSIMSEQMWVDFESLYIKELSDYVRDNGAMVMLHNCGNGIYFKEQIEFMHPTAISMCHLPPDADSMEDLKAKYGDVTTFIGHIEPSSLITDSEESIRAEIRRQIDAYKKDGGFILATGCEYPSCLDDHYAELMVHEAKTYGKY